MTGTRADFDTITKGESTSGALRDSDPAELGQLTATVERILPAIERLWRYEGRDDAAGRRPGWLARLDVGLPEAGGGVEAVRRVEDDGIDSFQPPDQACCRWLMQDKSPPGQIKTVTRLRGQVPETDDLCAAATRTIQESAPPSWRFARRRARNRITVCNHR